VYGILLGGLLAGRKPRLRSTPVDYIFVALLVAYVLSAVENESVRLGVSICGSMTLSSVAPYFIVRCSLERRTAQREALVALVAAIAVTGLFALIEMRLWPHTYENLLAALGVAGAPQGFVHHRFGLLRARSSFSHPIDLGIGGAIVLAEIFILAIRSRVGVRRPWVLLGLAAALLSSISALSFGPFAGIAAALAFFLALRNIPSTRRFLAAGVVLLIALGFFYTSHRAQAPLSPRPVGEGAFAQSLWIRQLIIKRAWEAAATAGPFGWGVHRAGDVLASDLEFDVTSRSTDNAYLLIAIERGWVALSLWLSLPVFLALLVTRALRRAHSRQLALAILCGYCASLGTMVAMFTVWFGMTYASLFVVLVALTVNAAQAALPTADHARMRRSPAPSSGPPPPRAA